MYRFAGLFAAFLILVGSIHSPAQAQDKSLTVFAAASMKNALDAVDAAYTAKTNVKISASYAASSALAKQLEQGAPADIFVSADTAWMDYSIKKDAINASTRVDLLGNTIVLIAPKDSKIGDVTIGQGFDLAKLAGDGRITTGDVKAVPVGKYAKAALEKLGAWQAAEPKFAMAESVRAALALVARGEAALLSTPRARPLPDRIPRGSRWRLPRPCVPCAARRFPRARLRPWPASRHFPGERHSLLHATGTSRPLRRKPRPRD